MLFFLLFYHLTIFKLHQENSAYGTCDPLCSVDEVSSAEFEDNKKSKTDLFKAITIFASVAAGAAAINHSWVAENQVCTEI